MLKFALDELGLEPHRGDRDGGDCVPGVVTATFTGKAALVLRRKGTPARTIHSLIYSVIEATEEEIAEAQKKIEQAENEARRLSGFDRTTADAAIEAMRQYRMQRQQQITDEIIDVLSGFEAIAADTEAAHAEAVSVPLSEL